jgi:hypothetical protein
VREINVSHAGGPVHAGDKALTWETPAQRGRVNRYGCITLLGNTDISFGLKQTKIYISITYYLLILICLLGDSKQHSKGKRNFEDTCVFNRTKNISMLLR